MQRQVDECLDHVLKGEDDQEKIKRLREWAKRSQIVVPMVRLGVGAEKVDWNLPEGMPETVKLDEDMPVGMGETTIALEWRRITKFFATDSNMNNLVDWKREQQWVNLLEGLHPNESKIITAIKDGTLLTLYPELEPILPEIGIKEYNAPVVQKKKRGRSRKKSEKK